MADRGWKKFERRLCRDVGTERIPVTGERHGADGHTSLFCFQFKLRRALPEWLFRWLGGIVEAGSRSGKVGVLVLKKPRMKDTEALVVLRWADWVEMLGPVGRGKDTLSARTLLDENRQGAVCEGDLHGADRILQPEVSRE